VGVTAGGALRVYTRVEQYTMFLTKMRANMLLSPHCYAGHSDLKKIAQSCDGKLLEVAEHVIISDLLICNLMILLWRICSVLLNYILVG